jgi:Zn-dependent peptidase ImmA (M78 family)
MKNIRYTTKKLITKHKTNDPFWIAQEKGIIVLFEELGSTLGYYHAHKRIQLIHINNKLNELEQRFVCAHELGHAILHPRANTPFLKKSTFFSIDKIEVEANTFAVELLLPDDFINDFRDTSHTLQDLAAMNGIPREFAKLKFF